MLIVDVRKEGDLNDEVFIIVEGFSFCIIVDIIFVVNILDWIVFCSVFWILVIGNVSNIVDFIALIKVVGIVVKIVLLIVVIFIVGMSYVYSPISYTLKLSSHEEKIVILVES